MPDAIVFAGKAFQVRVRQMVTASGRTVEREILDRVGAAAVVAEHQGRLVLIRQYRPAVEEELWELPAGKIDAGESPEAAARRELTEETGYEVGPLSLIAQYFPSPGYTAETVSIFYGHVTGMTEPHPDADEEIQVCLVDQASLQDMLAEGEIKNGLLLVGALWWMQHA